MDEIRARSAEVSDRPRRADRKRPTLERQQSSGNSAASIERAQLQNVRVLQRNLLYVVGIPSSIAREDILRQRQYFGRFGKIVKIAVRKKPQQPAPTLTTGASAAAAAVASNQQDRMSFSAYVTFKRSQDAQDALRTLNGTQLGGSVVRCTFGTSKYCLAFLRGLTCNNPSCLYLHELARSEDCCTKEDLIAMDRFAANAQVPVTGSAAIKTLQSAFAAHMQTGAAASAAAPATSGASAVAPAAAAPSTTSAASVSTSSAWSSTVTQSTVSAPEIERSTSIGAYASVVRSASSPQLQPEDFPPLTTSQPTPQPQSQPLQQPQQQSPQQQQSQQPPQQQSLPPRREVHVDDLDRSSVPVRR